jgi:two-component system, NarL family, response regulator NreC
VITIVLADDHPVVRSGLRALLDAEEDLEVVAEAGDVPDTVRYIRGHQPDVAVVDLNMPGGSTLPGIAEMHGASPETKVVVLTMQADPSFAREALAAGATAYVVKAADATELKTAIRTAAQGRTYLDPELGARMAAAAGNTVSGPTELTDRELGVLKLLALGHTNAEIAEQLFLSVRTVESHRARIQRKLGTSGRAELVRYARDNGVID